MPGRSTGGTGGGASLSGWVEPELATLTHDRFSSPDWLYERKFDGERCLAISRGGRVSLLTRNRQQVNGTYPELAEALAAQRAGDFLVDGEVVAFAGRATSFARLQRRLGVRDPREFARQVAELLAARNPDLVTTEQRKDNRGPRVYLDIMRNAYAQLAVAPYSVRARPGAPVATPLSWDELDDEAVAPGQFTLRTVPDRIRAAGRAGGPWAGLARRRPGLRQAQESLRRLAA